MKRRLLDRLFLLAYIDTVDQPGPRFRHITLTGPQLAGLTWQPGQHVRLQVGAHGAPVDWLVGALRTYTVWNYDGRTLELVVFDHGDSAGPGAIWARSAQPGEPVRLLKPEGGFTTVLTARYHLFAGDETAAVAAGAMLRDLPADVLVFGCLEVDSPAECLDIARDLDWSFRQGRPATSSRTLVDAVRALALPEYPGIAYLAGEARTIQLIREHLVTERHWPRRDVRTKPFWATGKKGME